MRRSSNRIQQGRCLSKRSGGAEGIRTPDPLLAKQVLSQLSYGPTRKRSRLERVGKYRGAAPTASRHGGREVQAFERFGYHLETIEGWDEVDPRDPAARRTYQFLTDSDALGSSAIPRSFHTFHH
jgi:hypothetical protein